MGSADELLPGRSAVPDPSLRDRAAVGRGRV